MKRGQGLALVFLCGLFRQVQRSRLLCGAAGGLLWLCSAYVVARGCEVNRGYGTGLGTGFSGGREIYCGSVLLMLFA